MKTALAGNLDTAPEAMTPDEVLKLCDEARSIENRSQAPPPRGSKFVRTELLPGTPVRKALERYLAPRATKQPTKMDTKMATNTRPSAQTAAAPIKRTAADFLKLPREEQQRIARAACNGANGALRDEIKAIFTGMSPSAERSKFYQIFKNAIL